MGIWSFIRLVIALARSKMKPNFKSEKLGSFVCFIIACVMHSRNVIIFVFFRKYSERHSFDWQIMINASKILYPRIRNEFRCHQLVCSASVVQRSFDVWKLCEKPSWISQNNLLFKSIFIFFRFKWSVNSDLWSIENPYIYSITSFDSYVCLRYGIFIVRNTKVRIHY